MSLSKQIYLYSIDTSCFYEEEEQKIHKSLLNLYSIRKRLKNDNLIKKNPVEIDVTFWKRTINKLIQERKDELVALLDERLKSH